MEEGEKVKREGELITTKPRQKTFAVYALAIAIIVFLLSMSIPSIPQTRITVVTYLNSITNVSVETPRIPLIVWLIPSSAPATGAYTINVNVYQNSVLVFNSTLQDVPSGQYTFVWVRNGQPESGTYHITVQLLKASIEMDIYTLDVTF